MEKLKGHGAGAGEVTVVAGEGGADIFRGAGLVVGGGLHDEGDAAGAVALVGDFLVDDAGEFAGALLDGAVDVVGGHVGLAGLEDEGAKAGVAVGIAAAGLGGEGEVAREAGENLAAAAIGDGFAAFDFGPLVMAGHRRKSCELRVESGETEPVAGTEGGSKTRPYFFFGVTFFTGLPPGLRAAAGAGSGSFILLITSCWMIVKRPLTVE